MKKDTVNKKTQKIAEPASEPEVLDWVAARKHLDDKIEEYKNLIGKPQVNPFAALFRLHGLKGSYNQGVRTPELYRDIMNFK